MCVILVADHLREILKLEIENAWRSNSHGAGFAYRSNKKVHVKKGLMNLGDLKAALKEVPENHDSFVLHMRVATHGAATAEYTHPFEVEAGKAFFFHNGVESQFGKSGPNGFPDSLHIAYILSCLDREDRPLILDNMAVPSKFVLIDEEETQLFGHFQACSKNRKVEASNTFWEVWTNSTGRRGKKHYSNWPERTTKEDIDSWRNGKVWCYKNQRWVNAGEEEGFELVGEACAKIVRGNTNVISLPHNRQAHNATHPLTAEASAPASQAENKDVKEASAQIGARDPLVLDPDDRAELNGFCSERRVADTEIN